MRRAFVFPAFPACIIHAARGGEVIFDVVVDVVVVVVGVLCRFTRRGGFVEIQIEIRRMQVFSQGLPRG